MSKKTITTIAVLIAIAAFIAYTFVIIFEEEPIIFQGEIETTQIRISSKIPGRIDQIAVTRGQKVNKGDFMFSIDSPEINAKLASANAAKSAAVAQKLKAHNGAQSEDIDAAYSVFVKAEAAAKFGEKTFARVKNLYDEGVLPEQKYDEAETRMKAARETANAAKSIWQKAEKGARPEDKAAAKALVARADAAIEEVEAYLAETTIDAVADGEVSGINVEEGELVPTGFPVVTLIDMDNVWLTLYVREDFLNFFTIGSTFTASVPAIGEKSYEFKVNYVSPVGDFARWNATKTSGEFDLKSFEIEAIPVTKIEGLRPGMTAIVKVIVEE